MTSGRPLNIFLEGQGAGGYATASSIISDIYEICNIILYRFILYYYIFKESKMLGDYLLID